MTAVAGSSRPPGKAAASRPEFMWPEAVTGGEPVIAPAGLSMIVPGRAMAGSAAITDGTFVAETGDGCDAAGSDAGVDEDTGPDSMPETASAVGLADGEGMSSGASQTTGLK